MTVRATRILAMCALGCYGAFALSVALMPLLKDGYSPVEQTVSEGAIGAHGWLQVAGLLALAAGTTAVAALLRASVRDAPAVSAMAALLLASAVATVLAAAVPTDAAGAATRRGDVHLAAAAVAFVTTIAAMLVAARACRRHVPLRRLAPASLLPGSAALALLVVTGSGMDPSGLWQRATIAVELAWLVAVACALARRGPASAATDRERATTIARAAPR